MEIYKETNTAASKEFEKLLDNQISKTKNLIKLFWPYMFTVRLSI